MFDEYKAASEAGADPPLPWKVLQAAAQQCYRMWSENEWQYKTNEELDWQNEAETTCDNVVLTPMAGSARDAVVADASIVPSTVGASPSPSVGGDNSYISETTAIARPESEPGCQQSVAAKQNRRSLSRVKPSDRGVLTTKQKQAHEAKAVMLDDISAVITGWAQDAREVAAGNTKRIVESQFPADLIDSMMHSASALRGRNTHDLTRLGTSQEDIRLSAGHQASNIVREVAMMARTAQIGSGTRGRTKEQRKNDSKLAAEQKASHMERDRSSLPPTNLPAVTSPKHHRPHPPRAEGSASRGPITTTTCAKAPPSVPQQARPLSDKLYDISVRRQQHQQQIQQLQQLQQQQQQQLLQKDKYRRSMLELGNRIYDLMPKKEPAKDDYNTVDRTTTKASKKTKRAASSSPSRSPQPARRITAKNVAKYRPADDRSPH